jgi:2,4-dichlorophenol 6-monooxygenase
VPLQCLVVGRDFADSDGTWADACEIEESGALLVRPDQHVAWRARTADPAAAKELEQLLVRLLGS